MNQELSLDDLPIVRTFNVFPKDIGRVDIVPLTPYSGRVDHPHIPLREEVPLQSTGYQLEYGITFEDGTHARLLRTPDEAAVMHARRHNPVGTSPERTLLDSAIIIASALDQSGIDTYINQGVARFVLNHDEGIDRRAIVKAFPDIGALLELQSQYGPIKDVMVHPSVSANAPFTSVPFLDRATSSGQFELNYEVQFQSGRQIRFSGSPSIEPLSHVYGRTPQGLAPTLFLELARQTANHLTVLGIKGEVNPRLAKYLEIAA